MASEEHTPSWSCFGLMKILLDKPFGDDYSVIRWFDRMIDETDKDILNIIQHDGRISNAEIARQVGLAPSAVLERLRKLEERKVVRGYNTSIDPKQVGYGLTAFISVRTNECSYETDELLANIPEVLEVHDVAGEDSYLLKVVAADPEDLSRLLKEKIKAIPTVVTTRTTVVLQTVKEVTTLPLDRCEMKSKGKKN
jgi:Lrp/AsnC family transcriptional regulator, leucine-responsive regulatory protein